MPSDDRHQDADVLLAGDQQPGDGAGDQADDDEADDETEHGVLLSDVTRLVGPRLPVGRVRLSLHTNHP